MMCCSGLPNSPKALMRFSTASRPNISMRSLRPRACRSLSSMMCVLLLRKAGGDPDATPSVVFAHQEIAELLWRGALDHDADGFEAFLDGLVRQAVVERLVQFGDDGRRRAARRKQAVPGGDVIAGQQAGLDRRRHVRHRRKAVLAGDRK